MFNVIEFRVELLRKKKTFKDVAKAMGITVQGLYYKAAGRSEFTISEVRAISKCLRLSQPREKEIFLSENVRNNHKNKRTKGA